MLFLFEENGNSICRYGNFVLPLQRKINAFKLNTQIKNAYGYKKRRNGDE